MQKKIGFLAALILLVGSSLAFSQSVEQIELQKQQKIEEIQQLEEQEQRAGGSQEDNNINLMIGFFPELGGFTNLGPLKVPGATQAYNSFTGGFGGSIQAMYSYVGAEFDLGYQFITGNPNACTAYACPPNLAITQTALLADIIANPHSESGVYLYGMVGGTFNTLTATNYSGYGTYRSNGPVVGLGVMLMRAHPKNFFGDFELRYTDYGNFGSSANGDLSSLMLLVKIGLRLPIPTGGGGNTMMSTPAKSKWNQAPQQPQQNPAPQGGGGLY